MERREYQVCVAAAAVAFAAAAAAAVAVAGMAVDCHHRLVPGLRVFCCPALIWISAPPFLLQVLAVNEFNSTRKRMSVVVRDPQGQVRRSTAATAPRLLPPLGASPLTAVF